MGKGSAQRLLASPAPPTWPDSGPAAPRAPAWPLPCHRICPLSTNAPFSCELKCQLLSNIHFWATAGRQEKKKRHTLRAISFPPPPPFGSPPPDLQSSAPKGKGSRRRGGLRAGHPGGGTHGRERHSAAPRTASVPEPHRRRRPASVYV